tara:strand:+ start:665 stop:880 length:216 start_codon:yes stop_codon:yes gene_type:complete
MQTKIKNNYENEESKEEEGLYAKEENGKVLMAKFKPHMMYSKAGKGVKANTYAKHLELKKKGYGHSKPKKK